MISICVDPRIELLTAIQLFTSWSKRGIYRENYHYKENMVKFFEGHFDHWAIKLCEELIQKGFSYDAPVGFMMHLSNPPELKIVGPFSKYHIIRAGGAQILHEFVEALRDFSFKSDFPKFWEQHLSFYRTIEEKASSEAKLDVTINRLEDYFGVKQYGYHVVLAPLFTKYTGYGYSMNVNGQLDIYSFLGPSGIKNDIPIFSLVGVHEFAHSFVNPLTGEFRNQFIGGDVLFNPVKSRMAEMAYGNWETMVNEHVVRAIDIRITEWESAKEALEREEREGFIYIKAIFNLLEKYEKQRDRYPTFRDFYSNIVELLNSISYVAKALENLKTSEPT